MTESTPNLVDELRTIVALILIAWARSWLPRRSPARAQLTAAAEALQ